MIAEKVAHKIEVLPEQIQAQLHSLIDVLYHSYKMEKEINVQTRNLNNKKVEILSMLTDLDDLTLLLNIENLIKGSNYKMTAFEKNELDKGWKDFEEKKFVSHKTVMQKADELLK